MDTVTLYYTLPEWKIEKVRGLPKALIWESVRNRMWVSQAPMASICGVAASFSLAYSLGQIHSRALQCNLHRVFSNQKGGKVILSRAGLRDLQHWRALREEGRAIQEELSHTTLQSDASDFGY